MYNQEAARYARWAAWAATLIVLIVAAVYGGRTLREARARRHGPVPVPASVQQQSAQISFSKVEQDRTVFTIRASHSTQYKDRNRSLLEDVWITIYGKEGQRSDNIHTRECTYEPETGYVRCEGQVQIDIGSTKSVPGDAAALSASLEVTTSNLLFNRNTGEASTQAPVDFRFAGGSGRGVGISYSTRNSIVRVEHSIKFDLAPSAVTDDLPITATGMSLEVRRDQRTVVLNGPTLVRQGDRELSAGAIAVGLDDKYRAERVVAEGNPRIRVKEGGAKEAVSADRFEASLNATGHVEGILADGGVSAIRTTTGGSDHFSAARVEFDMLPDGNLIKQMIATGGVEADSRKGSNSQLLKTGALRLIFSAADGRGSSNSAVKHDRALTSQKIEMAETLAPATIESKTGVDITALRAKRFVAQAGRDGRLSKLFGHSGVDIRRQANHEKEDIISAAELAATFDPHAEWDTLDETGNVHFSQAGREAVAAKAHVVRATDTVTLEGAPIISDSMSRSTAAKVVFNQRTGELSATGGVVSTYTPTAEGDAVSLGSGAAHISADKLSGSTSSGHVVYTGHARLWQGAAVLDCDQIEVWRDAKKMQATGNVVAVFPQTEGPFAALPGTKPASRRASSSQPVLWKVRAPMLTYLADEGKAHLEGGVQADSSEGSLESHTLDVFFGSARPGLAATQALTGASPSTSRERRPESQVTAVGRQMSRVVAEGDVVVRQGDRRGMADRAEYTAA
ncbi:MAG TPA: LPS export ABC transporter periplasmic protein LptC, partial [Candidatus Acidoferrales bacterium]|nr:LPS export ABC transporter periplasmic protein LptC [Candidatus Acidoferrales bacterium]